MNMCVRVCVHTSVYMYVDVRIHTHTHTAHLDAAALDEKLTDRVVSGDGRQAQRRVPATAEVVVVDDVVVDVGGGGVPLGREDGEQQFAHD